MAISKMELMPYEKNEGSKKEHDTSNMARLSKRAIVNPYAEPPRTEAVRRNSQDSFDTKGQTVIVFDWDDTLFPTTWVRHEKQMHWKYPLEQQTRYTIKQREGYRKQLDRLAMDVEKLLLLACELGHVVIVTLALNPWVTLSSSNFFERVGKLIKAQNIDIVYAQEAVNNQEKGVSGETNDEIMAYWTGKKRAAIEKEIRTFYEKSNSSWKNVLSIGDSDFERRAAIQSMEDYADSSPSKLLQSKSKGDEDMMCRSGFVGSHYRRIRMKTVKMFDSPNLDDITTEIAMLYKWLPFIVKKDGGFDVNLEDDERLYEAHFELTGEDLR